MIETKNDMKNKTETVLLAFTATVSTLMSIPAVDIEPTEPADIDFDNLPLTDGPLPEVTLHGYDLLAAIHSEEPHFQQIAEENRKANWEDCEVATDKGLRTEINHSIALVNISDTVEGCAEILKRHQFGFKNGSRNSKGAVVIKPYTEAEHRAAQSWADCVKNGRPAPIVVGEDDSE